MKGNFFPGIAPRIVWAMNRGFERLTSVRADLARFATLLTLERRLLHHVIHSHLPLDIVVFGDERNRAGRDPGLPVEFPAGFHAPVNGDIQSAAIENGEQLVQRSPFIAFPRLDVLSQNRLSAFKRPENYELVVVCHMRKTQLVWLRSTGPARERPFNETPPVHCPMKPPRERISREGWGNNNLRERNRS